jgi:hypothetical protein
MLKKNLSNGNVLEKNFMSIHSTKTQSIKCVFVTSVFIFLLFFIFVIFYSNFLIVKSLYDEINQNYLRQYVMGPLSNLNENFTKSAEIRLRVLEQVILESKMQNMKIMTEYASKSKPYILNTTGGSPYAYHVLNTTANNDRRVFDSSLDMLMFTKLNFYDDFKPEEIVLFNPDTTNSIYLYNDYERNRPYLRNYLNDYHDQIVSDIGGNQYGTADYIIVNPISIDDYYNYLKVISFDIPDGPSYTIAMRFNTHSTQFILNRDAKNITYLFNSLDSSTYFPTSSTMTDFFVFGLDMLQLNNSIQVSTIDSLPSHRREVVRMSLLYNLDNFFRLLNLVNEAGPYGYNIQLDNDFYVIGSLYSTIQKIFFSKDIFRLPPYSLGSDLSVCNSNTNKYISPINCRIANFDENNLLNITIYQSNVTSIPENIKQNIHNILAAKFGMSKYYSVSFFENLGSTLMGTYNLKKILVYISQINNLKFVAIEILNLESFSDVESIFIKTTTKNANILLIILGMFCILVFLISIMISLSSINQLIQRIHALNELKNQIFIKDQCLAALDLPLERSTIEMYISKISKGELSVRERYELSKNDKFYEQILIILIETKMKLNNFLKHIDSGKNYIYRRNKS